MRVDRFMRGTGGDKEGIIRYVRIGAVDEQMLDTLIPQMLAD